MPDPNIEFARVLAAAERGDVDSQLTLASLYLDGRGTTRDVTASTKWIRRAAEQGHQRAQLSLGGCLHVGQGVSRDYTEAYVWYTVAVAGPSEDICKRAMRYRQEIEARMTPSQIAEGRRRGDQVRDAISLELQDQWESAARASAWRDIHSRATARPRESVDERQTTATQSADRSTMGDEASREAPTPRLMGIYRITNRRNGRIYIGSSRHMMLRWREHLKQLEDRQHHSWKLQEDHRIFGSEAFEFGVVMTVEHTSLLASVEELWIERLNAASRSNYNVQRLSTREDAWEKNLIPEHQRLFTNYKIEPRAPSNAEIAAFHWKRWWHWLTFGLILSPDDPTKLAQADYEVRLAGHRRSVFSELADQVQRGRIFCPVKWQTRGDLISLLERSVEVELRRQAIRESERLAQEIRMLRAGSTRTRDGHHGYRG